MSKVLFLLAAVVLTLAGCGGGGVTGGLAVTVSPAVSSVLPNGSKQFTVLQNVLVDWSAPDGGTVTNNGLFTAPNTPGVYRVIATNALNPFISSTANVTVANVEVTVTPPSITVAKGSVNANAFTAIIAGSANKNVTWTVDQAAAGSIAASTADGSGNARANFTAGTTAGLFTIRATSVADPTVSETAMVTVLGASSVGLNPRAVNLTTTVPNNAVTFTAVLTDSAGNVDSGTPLTWDIPNNPVGATLSGASLRQRTFTVPTSFVGSATCQVRVRNGSGVAGYASVHVSSN